MPLDAPIVAIEVFELVHTPPVVRLASVIVPPTHTVEGPVIESTHGEEAVTDTLDAQPAAVV